MKVGKMTLEYMMKVHKYEMGDKTYTFKEPVMLPAGEYEVHIDGSQVRFEKVGEYLEPEDKAMLLNLLERGEHQ